MEQTINQLLYRFNLKSFLITTGSGVTHLRNLFPCYDQPEFRTTFKITVYHPEGVVISNLGRHVPEGPA